MNGHLSSKNKKVVADILRCKSDAIVLEYIQVRYQIGMSDCGLFAIAFAASICNSEDPGKVLFHQNSLRSHLKSLFRKLGDNSVSKKRNSTSEHGKGCTDKVVCFLYLQAAQ